LCHFNKFFSTYRQGPSPNVTSYPDPRHVAPNVVNSTEAANLTEASIWVEELVPETKVFKSAMTPAPAQLGTAVGFSQLLAEDPMKSTGLAAIETLLTALENSNATTVNELNKELTEIVNGMAKTDHSSTSIRSASDLFRR
ncbi:hypothetical protein COOONC_14341, partial [Cooperia oncophora]